MLYEYFQQSLKKKSFSSMIIYPAEILERRAQEEMVRSDKHHTYFVYAEIDFNHLDQHILHESDQELFITILLQVLNSDIRSTDILGLLPNNQGFVVLMPEAKEKAWFRIRRSFGEKLSDRPDLHKIFKEQIHPIVYPICLSKEP